MAVKIKGLKKERIVYDDTDCGKYMEEARETLADDMIPEDVITEELLLDKVYALIQEDWEETEEALNVFFSREHNCYGFLLVGTIGRWDGTVSGGFKFHDMKEFWNKRPLEDCDFVKFYDVDGHFYVEGIHHDGTVSYEIKELTERGYNIIERWEENSWWDDSHTEEWIHNIVFHSNLFSRLPYFAHSMYGCPKHEVA